MLKMQKELAHYSTDSAKKALFSCMQDEFMLQEKQKNIELSLNSHLNYFLKNINIEWFEEMDSTNLYLFQSKSHQTQTQNQQQISLCTTWSQTSGIGTHQRKWLNQPYQGLLFSLAFHLPELAYGFSLMMGYAVVSALNEMFTQENANFYIKWPNDIYFQGQKLGGILIQSRHHAQGIYVVLGVGLNLNSFTFNNSDHDSSSNSPSGDLNYIALTNLINHQGADFYFKLFAKILKYIWLNINAFQNKGLAHHIPSITELLYQPQMLQSKHPHLENPSDVEEARYLEFTYQGQKIKVLEYELLKQGFLQVLTQEGKVLVLI